MVVVGVLPLRSEAAGFSNLFKFLDSEPIVYTATSSVTSQNIALLKPSRNVDPTATGGGDIIVVDNSLMSEVGPAGSIADITENTQLGKASTYVVEEGDTISSIAERFSVSMNTIKWANDIKGNTLKIGQELVILPVSGIQYTVKNGGTIRDIVKKYGGDVDEVAEYNNMDADEQLAKGTVVLVPNGKIPTQATPSKKPTVRIATRLTGPAILGFYVHPLNYKGIKTQGIHGYNAIDIGAPNGTPIVAAAGGTVILARDSGWNGGYGSYTIIQHENGTQTVYGHMSNNISYTGQRVEQGEVIGYVGNTGRSTGTHLHFEVRGAQNPF